MRARPAALDELFGSGVEIRERDWPAWRGARIAWAFELESEDPRFTGIVAVYPEGALTAAGVHISWELALPARDAPLALDNFRARDVSRDCRRVPALAPEDIPPMPGYQFLRAMPVPGLAIGGPPREDGRWVAAWVRPSPEPETVVAIFDPKARGEGGRPAPTILARVPFVASMMSHTGGGLHGEGVGQVVLAVRRPPGEPLTLVSLMPQGYGGGVAVRMPPRE
jgi:hypothetical protein